MYAEAAVFASTLKADPNAICDTDPLRTVCSTVKTVLQTQTAQPWWCLMKTALYMVDLEDAVSTTFQKFCHHWSLSQILQQKLHTAVTAPGNLETRRSALGNSSHPLTSSWTLSPHPYGHWTSATNILRCC